VLPELKTLLSGSKGTLPGSRAFKKRERRITEWGN